MRQPLTGSGSKILSCNAIFATECDKVATWCDSEKVEAGGAKQHILKPATCRFLRFRDRENTAS